MVDTMKHFAFLHVFRIVSPSPRLVLKKAAAQRRPPLYISRQGGVKAKTGLVTSPVTTAAVSAVVGVTDHGVDSVAHVSAA